ncbi:MAG: hypothetical protein HZC40_19705 [Chloroflexi bacterium]|nr:hypothetical protein [Chloroflexota bacterium]
MNNAIDLYREAQDALERVWFVQAVQVTARTTNTLSLRLIIRPALFVHVFLSERSGALYFALVKNDERIFGIDRVNGKWHLHPNKSPKVHQDLVEGLEPKPLLKFLARVEELLQEYSLI